MKFKLFFIMLALLFLTSVTVASDFFSAKVDFKESEGDKIEVSINISVKESYFLYYDSWKVMLENPEQGEIQQVFLPEPESKKDPFTENAVKVYNKNFQAKYLISGVSGDFVEIRLRYQGCNEDTCFLPQEKLFRHTLSPKTSNNENKVLEKDTKDKIWGGYNIKAVKTGYMDSSAFISFLNESEKRETSKAWVDNLHKENIFLVFILIFVGGIALNLTPCMLPMIPVNLAILGAGGNSKSKINGFIIGGFYCLGMLLAYGIAGGIVILTGGTLGSWMASPWVNMCIALLFLFLAFAMWGGVLIDLSRFQPRDIKFKKGSYILPFFMGSISALLAGSCVAPVVFAVLIWGSRLYASGNNWGFFLPFLLGAGMGFPWPFAGAGIAMLPKPGKWMEGVKKIFAALIFVLSIYYAGTAFHLLKESHMSSESAIPDGWYASAIDAVEVARSENKLVFLDFWASWCKNCVLMDKTTFKDKEVVRALEKYVKIKVVADDPDDPKIKKILDHFNVVGLPTFIILSESKKE